LDRFVFLQKKESGKGNQWEFDPELMKHYGDQCREVRIVLIDDDIENVFPTSYAWWTATECKCRGDGQDATRRTQAHPEGEPWPGNYTISDGKGEDRPVPPCGGECPDLIEKRCKPSGDLRFILADFPSLGNICRIHTSSYRSIRQIHSALQEIQTVTGGRLAGLSANLVGRPEQGSYWDPKKKAKVPTTLYALSLAISGTDFKRLLGNLTEYAAMFQQTQKLLAGRVVDVDEKESDKAPEIAAEFYTPDEPEREPEPPARGSVAIGEPAKQAGKTPFQISGKVESVEQSKKGAKKKFLRVNLGGQFCFAFEKSLIERLLPSKDKFLVLEVSEEPGANGAPYLEVRKITAEPKPELTNPAKAQRPEDDLRTEEVQTDRVEFDDTPQDPPDAEPAQKTEGGLNQFALQTFNDLVKRWGYSDAQVKEILLKEWNNKDVRTFTEKELMDYVLPFLKAHAPKKGK
jgi:hypothetical protein